MTDLMLVLNQPGVLVTLFAASIVLVLLDYLPPIDWLAYLGYACRRAKAIWASVCRFFFIVCSFWVA